MRCASCQPKWHQIQSMTICFSFVIAAAVVADDTFSSLGCVLDFLGKQSAKAPQRWLQISYMI